MRLAKKDSIFISFQGEGALSGSPTLFIRMQGCNEKCGWCDQPETLKGRGVETPINDILDEVNNSLIDDICITGGEPFIQIDELYELCRELYLLEKFVTVETNGKVYYPIPFVNYMSFSPKLHNWPEETLSKWVDYYYVNNKNFQVKVVCDNTDNITSTILRCENFLTNVFIQPRWGTNNLNEIIDYSIEKNLKLSFQTHKFVGVL